MTPYGDINLGQHWLKKWFVAYRHQTIIWTNPDFPLVGFCSIHLKAVSQWVTSYYYIKWAWKLYVLELLSHFPGPNTCWIMCACWCASRCYSQHCSGVMPSLRTVLTTMFQRVPDSKFHGAKMGPSGAGKTQVGPMLAPWTLLSGVLARLLWNNDSW